MLEKCSGRKSGVLCRKNADKWKEKEREGCKEKEGLRMREERVTKMERIYPKDGRELNLLMENFSKVFMEFQQALAR